MAGHLYYGSKKIRVFPEANTSVPAVVHWFSLPRMFACGGSDGDLACLGLK